MCLRNFELNLNYDKKEDCFVGIGYKQLNLELIDSSGRINWGRKKHKGHKFPMGVWVEANGSQSGLKKLENTIHSDTSGRYFPGFHLFLSAENARAYYNPTNSEVLVGKFLYSDVITYGRNSVNGYVSDAKCVVTRYIKFIDYKVTTKFQDFINNF